MAIKYSNEDIEKIEYLKLAVLEILDQLENISSDLNQEAQSCPKLRLVNGYHTDQKVRSKKSRNYNNETF